MESSTLSAIDKQIYASIGERVTDEEFFGFQREFMGKNKNVFKEGEEENSLESTNVYRDYMESMEKLLDHYLLDKYS